MQKERHVKDKLFVIFEQTVDSVCSQHNHLLSLRYQILKSEEHLHTSWSSSSVTYRLQRSNWAYPVTQLGMTG